MTPGQPIGDAGPMAGTAGRHRLARLACAALAWLFVGCLVVQVFLVGLDIFLEMGGSTHRDFAYVYGWLTPVLVLLAGPPGRRGRARPDDRPGRPLAVQVVLPSMRDALPPWPHSILSTPWQSSSSPWLATRATDLLRATSADPAAES
jgi:hypothetical protein